MKSKISAPQQLHSVLQSLSLALVTVLFIFVLSGSSLAQGQLPFIGTRTFCGGDDGEGTTIISIRKDGFTTVKSDMTAIDEAPTSFAFSGMLSAKGILRGEGGRYLQIMSATAIRMHESASYYIEGKLCASRPVNSYEYESDDQTPGTPPFLGTRTFCGEVPYGGRQMQTAIVSIRKDGFTTVKTNMWGQEIGRTGTYRFQTFSGKLSAWRGLNFKSAREMWYGEQDYISGMLCTSHEVYSVAFSPDGRTLASGSADKTIRLWDVASGQELKTLKGHSNVVLSVAFSPDGKTLASGSWDVTTKLWDVASGRELKTLEGGAVLSVAFSSDSRTLATADYNGTILLRDVASGQELKFPPKEHSGKATSLAFSPNGRTLASGSNCVGCLVSNDADERQRDSRIKLWNVASGQELKTLEADSRSVQSVAFSPDSKTLARGNWDHTINFLNVASGQEFRTLKGHSGHVYSVAFSPDGKILASGSADNTIKLWDAASGQELRTFKGHSDAVTSVAFSPDGKTLAGGSDDNTIKVWDVASGQELKTLKVLPKESRDVQRTPAALRTKASNGTGEPPIKKNDQAPSNVELQPTQPIKTAIPGQPAQPPTSGTPNPDSVSEAKVDPAALELSYWESIRNSTDPEDFRAYLAKYPNGHFAELAKSRAERPRLSRNPTSGDVSAAERARNTHVFEVRDASKTSGWLTVTPGSLTFEPKKPQPGKNMTIQCSEIKHIEQGQSTVVSPHVNLFLTAVNGKEGPVVFYTSTGGTGVVGVFVKGLPAKPLVDITANVIRAITEACR